jgi:hypothetical protein
MEPGESSYVPLKEGFVQRATQPAGGHLPRSSPVSNFTARAFGYLKGAPAGPIRCLAPRATRQGLESRDLSQRRRDIE